MSNDMKALSLELAGEGGRLGRKSEIRNPKSETDSGFYRRKPAVALRLWRGRRRKRRGSNKPGTSNIQHPTSNSRRPIASSERGWTRARTRRRVESWGLGWGAGMGAMLALGMVVSGLAAETNEITPSPAELKKMSLEQLLNMPVTSVSKQAEPLSEAPSAIQVLGMVVSGLAAETNEITPSPAEHH